MNTKEHSSWWLAILGGVMVLAGSARTYSAPIAVTFDGTISSHFGDTWIQPGFAIGEHFVGQYVFESTTPGDPNATQFGGIPPGRTPYPGALLSFTATSRGLTLTSSGAIQNGILVDDNVANNDSYFVILNSSDSELYLDLRSSNLNLFTSQALPTVLPTVANFDVSAFFRIRTMGETGGFAWAQGNLDHIAVLPEPSIGGSVTGMSPQTGKVTCRNMTTKKTVRIIIPHGGRSWDCEQAGLIVNPGDEIRMTVTVKGPAD
jgi:hypothetical protein